MSKLKINKYDTVYFHVVKALDEKNGNWYFMFTKGFVVSKSQVFQLKGETV